MVKTTLEGLDGGFILEEIHRHMAILQLHWESRTLGPQRAGGRQRVNFSIVSGGLRLNVYE